MSEKLPNLDDLVKFDIITEQMKVIIKEDIEKQKNERIRPFSDAYYYGISRKYHKSDKFSKTFSIREYLVKAIKKSTNNQTIDDKVLDNICDKTDLEKQFNEFLKPLIIEQIECNYEDSDSQKFVHLNQYLFQ